MQKKYQNILPVPRTSESLSVVPTALSEPVKRKRSATVVACNSCRVKKTAVCGYNAVKSSTHPRQYRLALTIYSAQCDGNRPACTTCVARATTCVYISADPNETPAMAMKREIEALKESQAILLELLDILKTLPEPKAIALIRTMRLSTADPASLLLSIRGGNLNDSLPRQVLAKPATQGSVEFELMIRHAFAYPTLAALDSAAVGITSLLSAGLARSVASEIRYDGVACHLPIILTDVPFK